MVKPNLKHLGLAAVLAAGLAGLPGIASAERGDGHHGYSGRDYRHGGGDHRYSGRHERPRSYHGGHHRYAPRAAYHGGKHHYRHHSRPRHYGHGYRPHHYGHRHVHGPRCGHAGWRGGHDHSASLGLLLGYTLLYAD